MNILERDGNEYAKEESGVTRDGGVAIMNMLC